VKREGRLAGPTLYRVSLVCTLYQLLCTKQPILSYAAPFSISPAGRKKQSREAGLRRPKAHQPSFTSFLAGSLRSGLRYRKRPERGKSGRLGLMFFPAPRQPAAGLWHGMRSLATNRTAAVSTIDSSPEKERVRLAARPCALHASLVDTSSCAQRPRSQQPVQQNQSIIITHRMRHACQAFDIAAA
jgi:hypothetical protein